MTCPLLYVNKRFNCYLNGYLLAYLFFWLVVFLNWFFFKVCTGQNWSQFRFSDFICCNMIVHSLKPLKKFEILNFEFPYQSYGLCSFSNFYMVGFELHPFNFFLTNAQKETASSKLLRKLLIIINCSIECISESAVFLTLFFRYE